MHAHHNTNSHFRSRREGVAKVAVIVTIAVLLLAGGFGAWYFLIRVPALPPDLKLVSADSTGFVTIRLADVWDSDAGKQVRKQLNKKELQKIEELQEEFGMEFSDIERVTITYPNLESAGRGEGLVIFYAKKAFDEEKVKKGLEATKNMEANGKQYHRGEDENARAVHFHSERIAVLSNSKGIEAFLKQEIKSEGPLSKMLQRAAKEHHIVAGFSDLKELATEWERNPMLKELVPLLDFKSGTAIADFGKDLDVKIIADYDDKTKAEKAKHAIDSGMKLAKAQLQENAGGELKEAKEIGNEIVNAVEVKQDGEAVHISVKINDPAEKLTQTIKLHFNALDEAERRRQEAERLFQEALRNAKKAKRNAALQFAKSKLMQIAAAVVKRGKEHKNSFPGLIRGKDGKPLLSWRVAILPYLGHQDLYNRFKLDEPWDSEHNRKLIPEMPDTYNRFLGDDAPAQARVGHTHFQFFTGEKTLFGKLGPRFTIGNVPDGDANTLLVAEARNAVAWTAPVDLIYSDKVDPRTLVGLPANDFFLVVMADWAIREVPRTVSETTFRRAIMPNDGQPLGADWVARDR